MPLARFTEGETRLYLAVRGIITAERCNALWQVSGGLPLALGLLTLDHGAAIDPQEDTPTNVLRWLARQGQSKQQLVLHAALFSGPFHQDELTAFRFLPASEQERTRLYRWLITLPFVQHRALDGRHRYHSLAREWFSHALLQRSAQDYQVSRRALANYYRRQIARLQGEGGQQIYTSTGWLELAQALVYQLLCLPDDASHASAIEQGLVVVHTAKHKEAIISLLRECFKEPLQSLIHSRARTLAGELLHYLGAYLASQESLAAASALVERVSRAPTFPAPLLARIYGKRGMAYCSRSEYQQAIADFDRALAGVARCRYSLFDHGTAIEDCTLHLLDQIGDRDSPRAAFRAIEHRAAAKDSQTVTENCQAQRCATVTTIEEEAVYIHNGSRPDPCGIAPGHGARRGAGSTQNALRTLIVTSALLRRLETLGEWWGLIVDEVRFDLLILGEKRIQVNHQVFDHPERQQRHNGDLVRQTPHQELTGQAIQPIDAHRIRAADAMATGAAKGE
jgi:tetratricopeptide (TPR) repeat protein